MKASIQGQRSTEIHASLVLTLRAFQLSLLKKDSIMNATNSHFLTGWTHYSFEQEALSASDFILKLPYRHPRDLPHVESLHVHWGGKPFQDDELLRVRSAFFLCTQKRLELTRAHKDDARFSLREGMPMGLRGPLPLQFLSFLRHPDWKASYTLTGAHGGFSDLYSLPQLHPFYEFLGSLPGWEWSLKTNTKTKEEVKLLLSTWKIQL